MMANENGTKGRTALIGCGRWGKNLKRVLMELEELGAICDINPNVREEGIAFYGQHELYDMVDDPELDSVVIATPAETHFEIAYHCLSEGKHVFVEKPMSLMEGQARQLVKIADENNLTLMVGHLLNYHPGVIKMCEMVENEEFGELLYAYSNRLNIGTIRTEENVLWSFAPHDISIMLRLFGTLPTDVCSRGSDFTTSGIPDTTITHLKFGEKQSGHIYVSWLHPFKEQRFVVVGSRQMLMFENEKLFVYKHKIIKHPGEVPAIDKAEADPVPYSPAEPLKEEIGHFIHCKDNGIKPTTDGEEGVRTLSVLGQCQLSIDGGYQFIKGGKSSNIEPAYTQIGGGHQMQHYQHHSAHVDEGSKIGVGTKIWHGVHVMSGARIGSNCTIGQNCYIASRAQIGDNVKIQNNVSVYDDVLIADNVFIGPSVVFTNVKNPRADINRKKEYKKTTVAYNATIGANSTIVCGVVIGEYAFVGAGAVNNLAGSVSVVTGCRWRR